MKRPKLTWFSRLDVRWRDYIRSRVQSSNCYEERSNEVQDQRMWWGQREEKKERKCALHVAASKMTGAALNKQRVLWWRSTTSFWATSLVSTTNQFILTQQNQSQTITKKVVIIDHQSYVQFLVWHSIDSFSYIAGVITTHIQVNVMWVINLYSDASSFFSFQFVGPPEEDWDLLYATSPRIRVSILDTPRPPLIRNFTVALQYSQTELSNGHHIWNFYSTDNKWL